MKLRWRKEGLRILIAALVLSLMGIIGLKFSIGFWHVFSGSVTAAGLLMTAVILVFFRDPERFSGAAPEMILSPADGRVVAVEEIIEKRHFGGPARRVAIFMHIGNVHVQRMPVEGRLLWMKHIPGRFLPAMDKKAWCENEQRGYAFERRGAKFVLVQIAGLIAQRTMCWIQPEREYRRGERLGMIAFGSEIDIYLPLSASVTVHPGEKVYAGRSVIGEWK
ncbi:phosphatidylserine decarboxylase family protein [bacterium]|nr:phosphatidylserine decarboxylase family protein [bacterium]